MNRYELTYIIDTALEETARKELIEKVSALIAANGWYVLVTFKAPADLPRELERNLEIYDDVLRYLVVKLEVKRSNVKPRAPKAAPAVEAPVEAAETVEAPADAE